MEDPLSTLIKQFQKEYKAVERSYMNDACLLLKKEYLLPAVQRLKNEYGFNFFIDITAVDYWPQDDPRMHIIYQFYALESSQYIRLRVPLKNQDLKIESLTSIFTGANWYEREVYDMFGVQFENHPDMRRIIMPYDWVGNPLRKDYPLGYEEVQFTFNFDEIDVRKPYAKE
jgi:NADH-quinone oxidoreductase subunit C